MGKLLWKRLALCMAALVIVALWLTWAGWLAGRAFAQEASPPPQAGEPPAQSSRDAANWARTRQWQHSHGPYMFWTYERKAAFATLYGYEPGPYALESSLCLPQEGDVSEAAALALAVDALTTQLDLTGEEATAMKRDVAFYAAGWTEALGTLRCWQVRYRGAAAGPDGLYPLLYQVTVPSPTGQPYARRGIGVETLMARGLSQKAAARLAGCSTLYRIGGCGRFYHVEESCPSVAEKHRPMEGFPTGLLEELTHQGLMPCPFCVQ